MGLEDLPPPAVRHDLHRPGRSARVVCAASVPGMAPSHMTVACACRRARPLHLLIGRDASVDVSCAEGCGGWWLGASCGGGHRPVTISRWSGEVSGCAVPDAGAVPTVWYSRRQPGQSSATGTGWHSAASTLRCAWIRWPHWRGVSSHSAGVRCWFVLVTDRASTNLL